MRASTNMQHFHEIDRILTTQPKRASLITENIKEMMFDCEEFYELTSSFVIKLLIAGMATLPIYFGGRCISYHNNIELVRNLFLEDPRVKAGVILHGYLALCRNLDTFRFILEKCDYEPRNRDEHGRSLAHWIALEGTVAQMQIFLLDDRIDSNCLNRSTDFGGITTGPELFNPSKKVLILALCNPDPAMFKLIFLDPRTDVWATDFNGDTLLDMAIRSVDSLNPGEMIGTIKVILDDGRINPNTRSLQAIATGLMPIHLAILRQIHPLFTILADDQRVDMSVMFDGLSLLDFANLNCEIDFVHSIKQRLLQ